MDGPAKGKDLFLDLRRKTQQAQDLCYPGAGDAFLKGDIRLSGNMTGFQ